VKAINLGLRFALELAAIAALIVFAFSLDAGTAVRVLVALATAGLFIAVWGRWCAPNSDHRLDDPARLGVEVVVFAAAAVALAAAGEPLWAAVFAGLVVINEAFLWALDLREF
jgi:hypothetical protein